LMAPEACSVALANFATSVPKIAERLKPCKDLTEKICADVGADTQSCNMVKSTTPTYTPERCAGMLNNYAEILRPLKVQEDRKKPLSPELIAKLADGTTAFGPVAAKVTVVEFADFECPYSGRATSAVHALLDKYGKQVRFVFRQYPLPIHRNARIAAEASLEAQAQGKFWKFHDKAFDNQSLLTRSDLERYAKEVGLDVAKLKAALDANTYAAAVDADMKLGEAAVVDRTPAMFVNGQRVMNPSDAAALEKLVEEALKSAS
jgi:protein-disulfide isomerase